MKRSETAAALPGTNVASPGSRVPGRPGAGAVAQALGAQRGDLGKVPGNLSAEVDLELRSSTGDIPQSASFMGSLTNMFFGRKGGYY